LFLENSQYFLVLLIFEGCVGFTEFLASIDEFLCLFLQIDLPFFLFQVISLAKQGDLTERQVERWWRRRRAQVVFATLTLYIFLF
jgi:hypothetical protein